MKVEVKTNYDSIRIYLNEVLYLLIKRSEFLSFQGLVCGGGKWQIEFQLVGGTMLCEYCSEELWKGILTELDKNIKL